MKQNLEIKKRELVSMVQRISPRVTNKGEMLFLFGRRGGRDRELCIVDKKTLAVKRKLYKGNTDELIAYLSAIKR